MRRPEHERCDTCRLQRMTCICDTIPHIVSPQRFVIVRHWKEARAATNTGRLACLALSRCTILDYGARDSVFDPSPLQGPDTWLLFPPAPPMGAPPQALAPPPPTRPATIVILDGTWSQARRMSHRVPGVTTLPRFTLAPRPGPVQRLRTPPADWGMATIEAMARALAHWGSVDEAQVLDDLFAEFVVRSRIQKGQLPPSRARAR